MKKQSTKQKKQNKESKKENQAELTKLFKKSLKEKNIGEKIEEDEEINNIDLAALEFHPFLNPSHSEIATAPVLEKIASSQPIRPRFFAGAETRDENQDEIKYSPSARPANESYSPSVEKYEPSMDVEPPVLRADFSEGRRTSMLDRSAAFVNTSQQEKRQSSERFTPETISNERRSLPFESQEKKYKESRLKRIR